MQRPWGEEEILGSLGGPEARRKTREGSDEEERAVGEERQVGVARPRRPRRQSPSEESAQETLVWGCDLEVLG